ncbi:hypothetical protein V6N13_004234 [Hibiscus sabdariffa]
MRETYWRRKRHPVPQSMSRPIDKENTTNRGSFTKGPIRKRVVGVVDENNVDILRCSAIDRSLCATTLAKLSGDFTRAKLQGFSIMRITWPFFLLMFNDVESRRNLLESRVLLQWFDTIQEWSSDIKLDRRHVWLAVRGVPVQAWSKHTFKNIAEVWGSLVYIDKDTSATTSFEQGCILIETDVMNRIEDVVELVVNGRLYPLRVHEIDSLFRTEVDSDED